MKQQEVVQGSERVSEVNCIAKNEKKILRNIWKGFFSIVKICINTIRIQKKKRLTYLCEREGGKLKVENGRDRETMKSKY